MLNKVLLFLTNAFKGVQENITFIFETVTEMSLLIGYCIFKQ